MSAPVSRVLATLGAVAKLLGEHDVDWAVLGAIAEAAEREGWMIRHLHPEGSLLRIAHEEHGAADMIAVEMDYQRKALNRARAETFSGGIEARVLAVEDVIVHKLIANRAQDDADIASIVEAQQPMDVQYLEHWMRVWEVEDRFAAILERHGLSPPEGQGLRGGPPPPRPPDP